MKNRVKTFFTKLFCSHSWKLIDSSRYVVKRWDNSKEGEVTLTLFECERCSVTKLIPSDRKHDKTNTNHYEKDTNKHNR